jgi:glucosamine--fructose-6-phosphate aminotransferase (isomerizing)
METAYVSAQAFSGADLLHGPLALVEPRVPVLAVVSAGAGGEAFRPVLDALAERRADVLTVGSAGAGIVLPETTDTLAPLLEILPFQLLARHVAVDRGGDPDAPRGLRKVTETL